MSGSTSCLKRNKWIHTFSYIKKSGSTSFPPEKEWIHTTDMILVGITVSHQVVGVCKVKLVSFPQKGRNLVISTVGQLVNMNFTCKLPMKLTLSLGQLRREVIYG